MRGVCIAALLLARGALAQPVGYEERPVEGWRLHIEKEFLTAHPKILEDTLTELRHQFYLIVRKVPPAAVEKLKTVPLWVNYTSQTPCMTYHSSAQWLKEHGFNPAMARGVELGNAETFLNWIKHQPWMVLHELAHAYMDQFLGRDNPLIVEAFEKARSSHKYESILYFDGTWKRHYAMNNSMEYFAEMSEAFFGVNDFYPFVRAEVQEFDPTMYRALMELWGEPGRARGTAGQ